MTLPESTQHRISANQTLIKDRSADRATIQQQIDDFYSNGGKIQEIETGVTSFKTGEAEVPSHVARRNRIARQRVQLTSMFGK